MFSIENFHFPGRLSLWTSTRDGGRHLRAQCSRVERTPSHDGVAASHEPRGSEKGLARQRRLLRPRGEIQVQDAGHRSGAAQQNARLGRRLAILSPQFSRQGHSGQREKLPSDPLLQRGVHHHAIRQSVRRHLQPRLPLPHVRPAGVRHRPL